MRTFEQNREYMRNYMRCRRLGAKVDPSYKGQFIKFFGKYPMCYILGGWKPAHRLAYVYYYGIFNIPRNWHVHHINGDRLDNSKDNLELLTRNEHGRHHQKLIRNKN